MRSNDFRQRWASHDVRHYRSGTRRCRHPLVGELELTYEALAVTAALDEISIVDTAEPNSPTRAALQLVEGHITTDWTQALDQLALVDSDRINPTHLEPTNHRHSIS